MSSVDKYRHLIDQNVTGRSAQGWDIHGTISSVDAINDDRVHVTFRSGYQVTIPLDLAQHAYMPDYAPATTDVALPTGTTTTLNKAQVATVIRALAQADNDLAATRTPNATAAVTFPDGNTLAMTASQIHPPLAAFRSIYGDLATQDRARFQQARADYFAA